MDIDDDSADDSPPDAAPAAPPAPALLPLTLHAPFSISACPALLIRLLSSSPPPARPLTKGVLPVRHVMVPNMDKQMSRDAWASKPIR